MELHALYANRAEYNGCQILVDGSYCHFNLYPFVLLTELQDLEEEAKPSPLLPHRLSEPFFERTEWRDGQATSLTSASTITTESTGRGTAPSDNTRRRRTHSLSLSPRITDTRTGRWPTQCGRSVSGRQLSIDTDLSFTFRHACIALIWKRYKF